MKIEGHPSDNITPGSGCKKNGRSLSTSSRQASICSARGISLLTVRPSRALRLSTSTTLYLPPDFGFLLGKGAHRRCSQRKSPEAVPTVLLLGKHRYKKERSKKREETSRWTSPLQEGREKKTHPLAVLLCSAVKRGRLDLICVFLSKTWGMHKIRMALFAKQHTGNSNSRDALRISATGTRTYTLTAIYGARCSYMNKLT